MPVVQHREPISKEGIKTALIGVEHKLDLIKEKLDIVTKESGYREKGDKSFYARSKNHMVWWKKIEEAASYSLQLFVIINGIEDAIDEIEVPRKKTYWFFNDLPGGLDYRVKIQAEDKGGKIIKSIEIDL